MSDDHGTGTGAAPGTGELETSKHVFTGPVFKQGEADSETVTSVTPAPITMIRSTAAPVSLKQQRLSRILNMRVKDLSEMTHKPEKTMFNPEEYKTFGSSYKNIGAGGNKRYNKIHGEDAALAQREDNAKKIEQAEMDADHWEMIRLRDTRSDVLLTEEEAKMLSAFLSGNALKDSMLIQGYKGDQNSRDEVLTAILEDFMSIDFDNYDISSDEAIAANALQLEELSRKMDAFYEIEKRHPEFFDSLPDKIYKRGTNGFPDSGLLQEKKKKAIQLVAYYRTSKLVMTDDFYRSHTNSEIGRSIDPNASAEEKRLGTLMWQRSYIATGFGSSEALSRRRFQNGNGPVISDELKSESEVMKYSAGLTDITTLDGEFAKAKEFSDRSNPHYDFFKRMENANDQNHGLYEKIVGENPVLTGTDHSLDTFGRVTVTAFASLQGIKNMSEQDIIAMLNDIYEKPAGTSEEEISAARAINIRGWKKYKEVVREQYEYLERKYPGGFMYLPHEELVAHKEEIQGDFNALQIMTRFVGLLKITPELQDSDPEADLYFTKQDDKWSEHAFGLRSGSMEFSLKGEKLTYTGFMGAESAACLFSGYESGCLTSLRALDLQKGSPKVNWDAQWNPHEQDASQRLMSSKEIAAEWERKQKFREEQRAKGIEQAKETLKKQGFSLGAWKADSSEAMKLVTGDYTHIDALMKGDIPQDRAAFESGLKTILDAYQKLSDDCRSYEENRHPHTALGKERKRMVELIRKRSEAEARFFEGTAREFVKEGKPGTWLDVLYRMKIVTVRPDGQLKNVGNGTSTVYKAKKGDKTVFFKKQEEHYDRRDMAALMRANRPKNMQPVDAELYDKIADAIEKRTQFERKRWEDSGKPDPDTLKVSEKDEDYRFLPERMGGLYSTVYEYIMAGKKLNQTTVNAFHRKTKYMKELWETGKSPLLSEEEHINWVCRLMQPSFVPINEGGFLEHTVGSTADANAQIRNVATSRLAKLLQIGDIVAESEVADLETKDGVMHGISMEGAPGTEMFKIMREAKKNGGSIVYSDKALKQLSILMVFDALCGQVDRKTDNYFAEYEVAGEAYVIKSIKAIDNDMAFGLSKVSGRFLSQVFSKDKLCALPPEFCTQIMGINEGAIVHELLDILPAQEVNAVVARLREIRKIIGDRIREDGGDFIDWQSEDMMQTRFAWWFATHQGTNDGRYFNAT